MVMKYLKMFYRLLSYIIAMTINKTSGGLNYVFRGIIIMLFVLLHDTLMMVAEATETCR